MEKLPRLISIALLVHSIILLRAQPHDETVLPREYGEENANQIQEKVQNLLKSITTNDTKTNEIYRKILQRDVDVERQAFHAMKEEFRSAHQQVQHIRGRSEADGERMEPKEQQTNVNRRPGRGLLYRTHAWTTIRAAGYVIFRRLSNRIEFLLLQANYGNRHWSSPKGIIDRGENATTTAMREVFEESGLREVDLNVIPGFEKVSHYRIRGKTKSVISWLAELKDPEKEVNLSHEHSQYKWLPLEEGCEVCAHPSMTSLLTAAHEFLSGNATTLEKPQ